MQPSGLEVTACSGWRVSWGHFCLSNEGGNGSPAETEGWARHRRWEEQVWWGVWERAEGQNGTNQIQSRLLPPEAEVTGGICLSTVMLPGVALAGDVGSGCHQGFGCV